MCVNFSSLSLFPTTCACCKPHSDKTVSVWPETETFTVNMTINPDPPFGEAVYHTGPFPPGLITTSKLKNPELKKYILPTF